MHKTKTESFCSRRCRSMKHAEEIFSAILRGNEEQAIAFMCWRCSNYGRVADEVGRTALHIASSCGKTKVVEWILKNSDYEAYLNAKDNESGYTPLHRSLFHGHLGAARCLIKHGAKMNALDHDGLMPLDHLMKDSPPMPKPSLSAPCEVYVWGSNSNFNLGIGNQQIRRFPDTVDYFRKNNISIKNVAMGKFHSIFVSNDGRAFSCGHGQGGRLGLDSEETVMTPNQILLSSHHNGSRFKDAKCVVVCASVGQDHSMILTEKGIVYTFGMNDHYQLGHDPPPPLLLSPKALPNVFSGTIGVQAAHYHSVAWSQSQVFTWGLNCGQLGHPKVDGRQIKPKAVSSLGDVKLITVAVGDGATVIASAQGEIFILQDYCCRKIGYCPGVSRMEVSGGRLDPALIKVKDIYLHPDPFSVQNSLLTPTLKSKRPQLKKYFKPQIEDMYSKLT